MSEGKFDAAVNRLSVMADRDFANGAPHRGQFRAAIALLEAAGKMNPEWWLMMAGQLSGINFSNQHPEVALVWLKQTFRALLESLPDEEPTVAASRKVKESK